MSEPIPESVPTSADPRSHRPTKRRALGPSSVQANQVEALFAKPDQEIRLPSGPKSKSLAPPPEIVANVQGSSAGAGSGEFHVYKASRRREYERLRLMDEEVKKEEDAKEFDERREEMQKKDEEKTNKNRAKREKAKQRKERAKMTKKSGKGADTEAAENGTSGKKLGPNPALLKRKDEEAAKGVPNADNQEEAKKGEEVGLVIHDDD